MLDCEVSRHRLLFGIAIVRRGSVTSAAERRGLRPAAIRKEVMVPCESVAVRRFNTFGNTLVGFGESAGMWETTSAAKIRNQRTNLPSVSLNSSATTDGGHNPGRPMAAHQLKQIDL
jgi:hypothetical protein